MRRHFLAALAALCAFSAQAVPAAPREALPDIVIPYQKFVLGNGLTLIVHEDHKAPIVAVNVWYHVGSKDERPGRTGFAHLFEHLMFNGSEHYDDDYFRPLEPAGATKMNGTTWYDRTTYFENVPTSALDLALWLESDRMGHLVGAIDQKKLDEQRGVVQNEKRQDENQPYGKVDEVIAANTYPAGHPYSWTTIGSMEDLNAASLDDVKDWFKTWYGAANAVLVIAGDVDTEAVKKKVELYFGDIAPGPTVKHQQAWVAKMSGTHRATMADRVPQARLYKTWNIPGIATRDFTLLDMASDVLAGGKNSRLYKRLVYDDQIATDVSASIGPFEIGSQFQITATAKPGVPLARIEQAVDEELARFLKDGPTAEELTRARSTEYAAFVRSAERVDGFGGKSYILAQSQVYGGSPDHYQQRLHWMRDARAADLRDVARQWLSDGVFVLEVAPFPEYAAASTGADRSQLPATTTPPALSLPPLQRDTLSNGLKLVLAERHSAPVVQLQLIVDAGYAADSLAKPGTAKFALGMIDEGTRTRDSLQIAARAEELGAQVGAGSTLDTSYISLNALTPRLGDSLELFSDILLNPTFPDKEIARIKPQFAAAIRQERSQPYGIASRIYPRLIYGEGHAYANPLSGNGTEDSINSMTRDELQAFYRRWVRPDNATLLIVGDTTLAQIKPMLEARLRDWRAPAEPLPQKNLATATLPDKPRVFLVNRTGAEQSLILAAELAPPRSDPDHLAMVTVNTALGGNFVSRMNMNLREDKHWAYGAFTVLNNAKGQRPFFAYAPVQTDKTAPAMQEVQKELRDLIGGRPLSGEELNFARDSIALSLPGENESASDIAASYANILTYHLPDTYYNDIVGQLQALTPERLQAVASRLVHPDALTWIVVGDLAKIEEPIRKLGIGEVKVLDSEGRVLR
ncbi:MAG: insulinase family protein [Nevskiaceae bacterium]|nr:MAG: insulinase family protein [Nevskiaceae bacterium]